MLSKVADVLPDGNALSRHVLPKDRATTRGRTDQAQQDFHQRSLARSIWAKEAENRVTRHIQIYVVQRLYISK